MALFKVDSARAGYPQCVLVHGSFVVPASIAYNQQIIPQLQTIGNPGTAGAQVSCTINPVGVKLNIFASPFLGQPFPATNTARMPAAIPTGAVSPIGSEFLIDFSAFPADVCCVQMDISRQVRNNVQQFAQATWIDTVNKLILVQTVGVTTGASQAAVAGSVISFQITLKDSIGI